MGGFKKKKSRSRTPRTGRPKGATGKTNLNSMDKEQKRQYFREAKQKERDNLPETSEAQASTSNTPLTPPREKTTRSGLVYSPSTSTLVTKSVGRPPLSDKAMTPNSLNARKRKLYHDKEAEKKEKERKEATSSARSAAVNVRWQNRLADNQVPNKPINPDDYTLEEIVMEHVGQEEINLDESNCSSENLSHSNEPAIKSPPSRATYYRSQLKLIPILPRNVFDSLQVFKRCYINVGSDDLFKDQLKLLLIDQTTMTRGQLDYKISKITKIFNHYKHFHETLFKTWLEKLSSHPILITFLETNDIQIPESILPRAFSLSRIAKEEIKKILSSSSKTGASASQRCVSTQLVINVAKAGNLNVDLHGDISLLADAVSCGRKFATKVLQALKDGKEQSLFIKNIRCDSVLATDWPAKLEQFVLQPENSRAVPGQDSISIRYGQRVPKYLLLKSKEEISRNFKEAFPDCKFTVSTLKREFPPYAVQPTTRDVERNSCPIHSNIRRLVKGINKELRKDKKTTLSTSCKQLSLDSMCKKGSPTIDPLSWHEDCATGECCDCPTINVDIDKKKLTKEVTICQWRSNKQKVKDRDGNMKEKNVFTLHPETIPLKEVIDRLQERLPSIRKHVYIAHSQWNAHKVYRENLDESSVITVEDYQMNIEVEFSEAPTSSSYSANKKTFALYPVCVEYVQDGKLKKGAVAFVTSDKKHDHQQVQKFEERLFEIMREKIRAGIINWFRFSDGCNSQFKSRHCIADLFNDIDRFKLKQAGFHLFESHEGKGASDSIGARVKCAFRRGMMKDQDLTINTADDVVNVIKKDSKKKTMKYDFFHIESFPEFERLKERDELVIDGIMQLHSFIVNDEKLYFKTLSCTNCAVNVLCDTCSSSPDADKSYIHRANEQEDIAAEGEIQEERGDEELIIDEEDDGKTDDDSDLEEEDEVESEDVNECNNIGDIVWGKHGRTWYPAIVVGMEEIPHDVMLQLSPNLKGKQIVRWWGEQNYSALDERNIEPLERNRVDEFRANRSPHTLVNCITRQWPKQLRSECFIMIDIFTVLDCLALV